MTLPSKELLSVVLKEDVLSVKPYNEDKFYKNVITYECRKDVYDIINIYELAHLCKEWLFNKSYVVASGLSCKDYPSTEVEYNCIIEDFQSYYEDDKPFVQFFGDTELEAIFLACEHILTILNIKG